MKVHGLEGIRVVDASSLRYVTNGNIYAPTMMTAEKSADLIRGSDAAGADQRALLPPPGQGLVADRGEAQQARADHRFGLGRGVSASTN